jgi:hypothetical protein
MEQPKSIERSVDSLQKLYAVVVALAIGQGISALVFVERGSSATTGRLELRTRPPAFIAFVVILVPFYHGMNRHLDRCYLERSSESQVQGALLFDFFVFFGQSSLLFLIAISLATPVTAFILLGLLLGIDVVWGLVSHWIHYGRSEPGPVRWALVNVVSLAFGALLVLRDIYSDTAKAWVLLVVACARTSIDYWLCYSFYFPNSMSPRIES